MGRKLGKPSGSWKAALGMGFLLLAGLTAEPLAAYEPAEAWGGDGHRVVCRIAWNGLTVRTREAVKQLLGREGSRDAFPDACVWADQIRARTGGEPDLARFAPYTTAHYVNFEPGSSSLDRGRCSSLSAGRNLHWVWDTFMVAHGGEEWGSLARRLDRTIAAVDEVRWVELDPLVWAGESYSLTETQVYHDLEQSGYVGQRYFDLNRHAAERRLQMAGVRLAAVLNDLFDPAVRR